MVAFYNAADQELYKKYKFLPQEKYRLGLTLPTDPVAPETIAPVPGGITNTNAFTNSGGGNDFNPAGNMFGEGTAVSPVYGGNPITGGFDGGYGADPISGDLPGGGNIVDEFGTDGNVYSETNFNNIKEEEEKKGFLSRMMNSFKQRTENLPSWAKAGITAAGMINPLTAIPSLISKFGSGDGGPSYGIAGLTDQQKSMYNNLAASGFLYDSNGIMKTKTGKNFSGKGYKEGQQDIYNEMIEEGYTLDSNGNVVKPDGTLASGYLKEKFLESNIIGKDNTNTNINIKNPNLTTNMINEFAATNNDTITNPNITSNIVDEFSTTNNDGPTTNNSYTPSYTPQEAATNQESYRGGNNGNQGSNNKGSSNKGSSSKGSSSNKGSTSSGAGGGGGANRGRSRGRDADDRMARGGRAGYFFGGRVNYKKGGRVSFKNGGLVSIL